MSTATLVAAMDALAMEDLGAWTGEDVYLFIKWADQYTFELEHGITPTPHKVLQLYGHLVFGDPQPVFLARKDEGYSSELDRRRRKWQKRRHIVAGAILERDGHTCVMCGAMEDLTIDHIVPMSRGGSDDMDNLQTACRRCNSRKGARV